MRADMHQRMDALDLAQPQIERDIGVARRQGGVVIIAGPRRRMAPIWLERDETSAEPEKSEMEDAVARVLRRIGPARLQAGEGLGQAREPLAIVRKRERRSPFGGEAHGEVIAVGAGQGAPGRAVAPAALAQRGAQGFRVGRRVAGIGQRRARKGLFGQGFQHRAQVCHQIGPRRDQNAYRRRDSATQGSGGKDRKAGRKDAFRPDAIAKCARCENQSCKGGRVGCHDPLEGGDTAAE